MQFQSYQTYRGLPAVAGVCSFEDAMRPGLSVDECVRRLKRYHYAFKRLHQIFTARITAEPIYELKMGFSLHAHLCAEHATAIRTRVAEMREPPLGLDITPDAALERFFDEILAAPTTEALVSGLYKKAVPGLQQALERHLTDTNPMVDHPSVRVCRFALLELADIAAFGVQTVSCLVNQQTHHALSDWFTLLDNILAASGGLDGVDEPVGELLGPLYSAQPYVYDGHPQRDERFPDPYNMGVNAETFLYDKAYPANAKVVMMFYKRIREIDVPEMMASIIAETTGKSWEYYRDMSRQLWDEARHAMMGEVGFVSLGVDWHNVMINFTWSLALNTQLTPLQRHGVLYFIEQGLMPRNGKRYEWEVAEHSGIAVSQLFQDYDWADEVLHAQIGRKWYVSQFSNAQQAKQYGDESWSKALIDWAKWREDGLTQHRNWWPEVYREACRHWGIEPDPEVLAFHDTYESKRADLQTIQAVGSA